MSLLTKPIYNHKRNYAAVQRTSTAKPRTGKKETPFGGQVLVLPLVVSKRLGKSCALFLQQLHYWLNRGQGVIIDNQTYIYQTYKGWEETLGGMLSVSSIRRAVKTLQEEGLIEVRQLGGCHRINYYRICYDELKNYTQLDNVKNLENTLEKQDVSADVHGVKMNSPCVQNEQMIYIDTKITNLDQTYKSEALSSLSDTNQNFIKNNAEKIPTKTPTSLKGNSTTAEELITIWNETVGVITHKAALTKDRARYLMKAFLDKFHADLSQWKRFCNALTKSDFLMGKVKESFKASLDWVLKFSTLQKIFEGSYGVMYNPESGKGGADTVIPNQMEAEVYQHHIDETSTDDLDHDCKTQLLERFIQKDALMAYHVQFHTTNPVFFKTTIHTKRGTLPALVCTLDGYIPLYEELFTDLFCHLFSKILGSLTPLTKDQIIFKKG